MSADEFDLIERYFNRAVSDPDVLLGIGDDAAVLNTHGPVAMAVDTLVAGVHFPTAINGEAIGHRALAVNLSDLAAMGATPRWCTLALTLPQPNEQWLADFSAGFFRLADRFATSLVGGDLTRGPLTISVQVLGNVAESGPLTRAGARAGDGLFVTGSLGDSAAALARFANDSSAWERRGEALAAGFLWPEPRVAAGLALIGVATACIDISDGLLADLGHLCAASSCHGVVELEKLPLSEALLSSVAQDQARTLALTGGDDYELLFSAAADQDAGELGRRLGVPVTRIGCLQVGSGTSVTLHNDPVAAPRGGYNHFR